MKRFWLALVWLLASLWLSPRLSIFDFRYSILSFSSPLLFSSLVLSLVHGQRQRQSRAEQGKARQGKARQGKASESKKDAHPVRSKHARAGGGEADRPRDCGNGHLLRLFPAEVPEQHARHPQQRVEK